MWVDNNPASPFYGRMYISVNDFNIGGGALRVLYSTTAPLGTPVTLNGSFIRDNQITGDLQGAAVYMQAMNEEGGSLTTRQNLMYRSTDGGATWANSTTGPAFPAVGRDRLARRTLTSSACSAPDAWRHRAGANRRLSATWSASPTPSKAASGDRGDVYYVRSTDAA